MSAFYCHVRVPTRCSRFMNVLAVAAVAALAIPAHAEFAEAAVDVQVLQSAERTILRYSMGGYQAQAVSIRGKYFQQPLLAGEPVTTEAGAPRLPKVCRSIIIPDDAKMAVRVLAAAYYELPADITPSKGSLPRSIDPAGVPYCFGETYRIDAFCPGELARLGAPYILRDYRGVVVELFPFQYNPITRVLRVYTDVTLEVVSTGPGQINVLDRAGRQKAPSSPLQKGTGSEPAGVNGPENRVPRGACPLLQRTASRAFHQIYKHHFVNYDPSRRYPPLNEEGDMLIIVHDPWIPNVQPLAEHKNSIGINTIVVGVSTIGNNATAIKDYIQNIYNTSDLAFVLLVGDAAQVATPYASGGASDPSYAKLAGGDDYPDIMVGRFSAETDAEVDTQVQRTIMYEAGGATQQDWFWRGAGIGSNAAHLDNIRDALLANGYTYVDRIYDPGATPATVAAALNDGRGIVNYVGQGGTALWGTSGFSISDVNALVNDNTLPFIFNVASLNGDFAGHMCLAEAWLRARHGSEPTGAIAAYMSSAYQYWAEPLVAHQEFIDMYLSEAYVSFGTLCFAGSCRMMDEYGTMGANMFNTWILFGDPSLRVVGRANLLGDLNCDGTLNAFDIDPFVLALTDPDGYGFAWPDCDIMLADCNGDGEVNAFDIDPFVELLTGG